MRTDMTPENQDERILAHTYLRVPLEIDIYDIEAGYEKKTPIFKTLNPLHVAPGLIRSFWGRVAENPEEVILCTVIVWWTRKALSDFETSPGYASFIAGLSASGYARSTVYVDSGKHQIEAMLEERVSITIVYFPKPVTDEQKARFNNMYGLVYGYGVSRALLHTRANRAVPCKGWVDGVHEKDGKLYEMGVIWHFWSEEELEKTFRSKEKVVPTMPHRAEERAEILDKKLTVAGKFERDLKVAGAEWWEEVHCEFTFLPDTVLE
ncbi:MAG: hypothetical protein Q9192_003080 [Flavoplaca navasiana]